MAKKTENIWAWLQAKGRILKVVSNPSKGTIKVYDEKGNLVLKKTNLTKQQVEIIEESFLGFVAKRLKNVNSKNNIYDQFDPMVA